MTEPPILSVRDLRFRYDTTGPDTLCGLSLDIPAGSVTVVLGANGAGKTTLLHVILGLLPPASG